MTKISPIAAILTANRAIPKRDGNVWHFYTREGLYLGRQIKMEQNGASAYIREIFGEGLKRLFYECKVIAEHCFYCSDEKFPLGVGIVPNSTYILTHSVDQISNTIKSTQRERQLISPKALIAMDENVNVGIFEVQKPYRYVEKCISDETSKLKKHLQIKHTIH